MAKIDPPIRILPMTAEGVGETSVKDVQDRFFLKELASKRRNGRYKYPTSGLDAEPGTIVLFQCENTIIASAVLRDKERFPQPKDGYSGALDFYIDSIRVFDPVGPALVRGVWPKEFNGFSYSKSKLSASGYPEFERLLTRIRVPSCANSKVLTESNSNLHIAVEDDESASPEGAVKYRMHRHLERDVNIVRRAKLKRLSETGKLECEACSFDFAATYGHQGAGFIEAHHKIPVSQLNGKTKTKMSDLALVCSNCHRILHRGPPILSIDELKVMLQKRKRSR